jgi:hypothetical protein
MIAAAIVWLIGVAGAVFLGLAVNRSVDDGEPRYSGTEIGWGALLWPLVILTLMVVEVYVRCQRRSS